jgi:hypothetical protein
MKSGLLVLILLGASMLVGGCASNSSPRANLSTVEKIGVAVPPSTSEPIGASDILQLYNLTVAEDRIRNSAAGAGAGAAVGAGVGLTGALVVGFAWCPPCLGLIAAGGAVAGGGVGAVAGATVNKQKEVRDPPAYLYEFNMVLPDLKEQYLASPILQQRALRLLKAQGTRLDFVPAAWDGKRYGPLDTQERPSLPTDVNLVLTGLSIIVSGKAKENPKLTLTVAMQWSLTKYNSETKSDEIWDAWEYSYESKRLRLSKWLADDGARLKRELDKGLGSVMASTFVDLPRMSRR